MPTETFDLVIVGGGPAGLSAAINGSSEGLKVGLLDSGPKLGGQALNSSSIENYPGFPEGVTGDELIERFVRQAAKFGTNILCPQRAFALRQDGQWRVIVSDDGQEYAAKSMMLTLGLSYRRLGTPNLARYLGRGALYGAPTGDPCTLGSCDICIIGGANSAGQAAMHFARNPNARIKILVRKKIADQMSAYLLDRIVATKNIEVVEGVEVAGVSGDTKLEEIDLRSSIGVNKMKTNHLFIFIGAQPKTLWLNGSVTMDSRQFVVTGSSLLKEVDGVKPWKNPDRLPLTFETSMPGIFAAGDVRLNSTKRVASAIGEGANGLAMVHEYLASAG